MNVDDTGVVAKNDFFKKHLKTIKNLRTELMLKINPVYKYPGGSGARPPIKLNARSAQLAQKNILKC
jgi:hypothetical protein